MRSTCSTRAARSRSPNARPTSAVSATSPARSPSSTSPSSRSRPRRRSPLATLLLEIGTEELPAAACREATAQLPELTAAKLGRAPYALYVGPRRLAFLIRDFDPEPPKEWLQGPPLAIGLDA